MRQRNHIKKVIDKRVPVLLALDRSETEVEHFRNNTSRRLQYLRILIEHTRLLFK
jgi:hypothetical protein